MIDMLRRASAVIGVLVLLPLAYNMATGELAAWDAGIRAAITLVAVVVARRLIGYLAFLETLPAESRAPSAES
jgi:hypothetical protein